MKITELDNLYAGYNKTEDYRILICAYDIEDARKIAVSYGKGAGLTGEWEVTDELNPDMEFDCDHVVSYDGEEE